MLDLFVALHEKYSGSEVRDVKFIVNPAEANDQEIQELGSSLAEVVKAAEALEGPEALM